MEPFVEKPIAITSVISLRGAKAHMGLDEKTVETGLFAGGTPLKVYEFAKSPELIDHIRVSPIGAQKTQWIRCWDKDGKNPLVNKLTYLVSDAEQLAQAINGLTETIRDKKFC